MVGLSRLAACALLLALTCSCRAPLWRGPGGAEPSEGPTEFRYGVTVRRLTPSCQSVAALLDMIAQLEPAVRYSLARLLQVSAQTPEREAEATVLTAELLTLRALRQQALTWQAEHTCDRDV